MLGGKVGLKNAVLFMQSGAVDGLLTVCPCAAAGSNAASNPKDKMYRSFDLMAGTPYIPSFFLAKEL
jgi:hypothetical protein